MSFILDALKKSESARQRDNWNDSAQIPAGSSRPATSRWLIFVAVLLLVNVLVLLVVFLKPDQTSDETVQAITATLPAPVQSSVESPVEAHSEPAIIKRRDPPQSEPVHAQPAEGPPATERPATAIRSSTTAAEPPATKSISHVFEAQYKSFNEVRANGSVQLRDLHLDIHVYSEVAGDRFVFINMRKYKESATLNEGPLVSEIVPDGVVLDYRGTRFLLPRE